MKYNISITQETKDSYAISVKGDSPENLQIITQTLSMIDDSLKKDWTFKKELPHICIANDLIYMYCLTL